MDFSGKVVLITGGTSGIGRATARRFASLGANVVFAGRRDEIGRAIARELQSCAGNSMFISTDVTKEAQVENLVRETVSTFGRLDIAFNNAGMAFSAPADNFTEEDYRSVFDTNVLGILLCQKYEIPALLQSGGGVIVNTSSTLGRVASSNLSLYAASKHAVEGLTKATALEFASRKIRVNAVSPWATDSAMIDCFLQRQSIDRRALELSNPMRRLATVEEVASTVLFLASDESSFINGTSIPIDGGFLAE